MVSHVFNPSTQEAKAGESLWVQGQSGSQSKFQDSQRYIVRPWFRKQTNHPQKFITETKPITNSSHKHLHYSQLPILQHQGAWPARIFLDEIISDLSDPTASPKPFCHASITLFFCSLGIPSYQAGSTLHPVSGSLSYSQGEGRIPGSEFGYPVWKPDSLSI